MCFGTQKNRLIKTVLYRDDSFECQQHMFWLRTKKINFGLRTPIRRPAKHCSPYNICKTYWHMTWRSCRDHLENCGVIYRWITLYNTKFFVTMAYFHNMGGNLHCVIALVHSQLFPLYYHNHYYFKIYYVLLFGQWKTTRVKNSVKITCNIKILVRHDARFKLIGWCI